MHLLQFLMTVMMIIPALSVSESSSAKFTNLRRRLVAHDERRTLESE